MKGKWRKKSSSVLALLTAVSLVCQTSLPVFAEEGVQAEVFSDGEETEPAAEILDAESVTGGDTEAQITAPETVEMETQTAAPEAVETQTSAPEAAETETQTAASSDASDTELITDAETDSVDDAELAEDLETEPTTAVSSAEEEIIIEDIAEETAEPVDVNSAFSSDAQESVITDWQWVDPDEYLTIDQTTGSYVLDLGGADTEEPENNPTFENIIEILPLSITAKVDGTDGQQEINLSGWTCDSYPEDVTTEIPSGSYTFTAALPEDYALADGTAALKVLVNFEETVMLLEESSDVSAITGGGTDNEKAIQLGTGGLITAAGISSADFVWFGGIRWLVLDGAHMNTGESGLFMCTYISAVKGVAKSTIDTEYQSFLDEYLTTLESAALYATTKTDGSYTVEGGGYDNNTYSGSIDNQKVFSLSVEEILSTVYFPTSDLRYPNSEGSFWLRSTNDGNGSSAAFVKTGSSGEGISRNVLSASLRPAVNISADDILFTSGTSSAKDAKTANGLGMTQVGSSSSYNGEYKLTLKDSSREFQITGTRVQNYAEGNDTSKLIVEYSGAVSGDNEYISAIVVDSSNTILYYGRLRNHTEDDGEGTATLDLANIGALDEDNTIYIFNEQCNGAEKTDYASNLVEVDKSALSNVFQYDITYNLTNATRTEGSGKVVEGDYFTAEFDAADGYSIEADDITVTMGGTELTKNGTSDTTNDEYSISAHGSWAYVRITNVTDDVVIAIDATKVENSASVSKHSITIEACEGYDNTKLVQSFTLSNTGTATNGFYTHDPTGNTTSKYQVMTGGNWQVPGYAPYSLASGARTTISIRPVSGLSAGTYTWTMKIRVGDNGYDSSLSDYEANNLTEITITFIVTEGGHKWNYSTNSAGDTITATCSYNSAHTASVKISASDVQYEYVNGEPRTDTDYLKTAEVTDQDNWITYFGSLPEIIYSPGTFAEGENETASITAGRAVASVSYQITPAEHTHTYDDDGFCTYKNCGYYEPATLNQGIYSISNAGQLFWFAALVNGDSSNAAGITSANLSASAVLTADINLGDREWTPIAPSETFDNSASDAAGTTDKSYSGAFDGNGHTISDFAIRVDETELTSGLFGAVSGTVKYLGVENANFNNSGSYDGRFGGICGLLVTGGTIENCYVTRSGIKTSSKIAGAICGANYGGTIKNCSEYANTVTGHSRIGHLVGDNQNDSGDLTGTVTNCYSDGAVVGSYSGTTSSIESSIGAADFASGRITYLLNGSQNDTDGSLIWKQTIGTDSYPSFSGLGVQKLNIDYVNVLSGHTFDGYSYDETQHWRVCTDDGCAVTETKNNHTWSSGVCTVCGYAHQNHTYSESGYCTCGVRKTPTLAEDGYYEISDYAELMWFRDYVNGSVDGTVHKDADARLTADITASGSWTPICSDGNSTGYSGVFDGNCHTITGLSVSATFAGLFGVLSGGTVKDLQLVGGSFSTGNKSSGSAGSIAALVNTNGIIENCSSTATVKVTYSGNSGGIVGAASDMTVTSSYFAGSVSGGSSIGAIVGNSSSSKIQTCYYLDTCGASGSGTSRDSTAFASGEVAYLLNGSTSENVTWYQRIDEDSCPELDSTHGVVYCTYRCDGVVTGYNNTAETEEDHVAGGTYSYDNSQHWVVCSVCGGAAADIKAHDADGADGSCSVCGYSPMSGEGTAESPYLIGTAEQLAVFAETVNSGSTSICGKLTADIDMSGEDWTPIGLHTDSSDVTSKGNYSGTFDGDGHVIKNLTVSRSDTYEVGFFGRTEGATIENLGIVNAAVSSTAGVRAGVLGGEIYKSTVTNCFTAGTITLTTDNSQKGGIAGEGANSTFTNCYTTYTTFTNTSSTTLTNCYAQGDTSGDSTYTAEELTGGVLAYKLNGSSSENVTWYQNLSGDSADSYPVLDSTHGTVYVLTTYTDCSTYTAAYSNDSTQTGKTGNYDLHDYDSTTHICSRCGTAADPSVLAQDDNGVYGINSVEGLTVFAALVNNGQTAINAKLTEDIDLSNDTWTPIGSSSSLYTGTFDGGGHSITLAIDSTSDAQALFGYVGGGVVIENIIVKGSVSGAGYCAGLVGVSNSSGTVTITNCGNEAAVAGTGANIAGILGSVWSGTAVLTNCYNTGTISGGKESAGISGWLGSSAVVTNCYNTGTVTGYDSGKTFARFNGNNVAAFTNCYQLSTVETQDNIISKTADEFASGEVAYLLNGSVSAGSTWYQKIGTDSNPVLTSTGSDTVYAGYEKDVACKDKDEAALSYSNSKLTGTITHTESEAYTTNSSQHWKVCTNCGEIVAAREAHAAGSDGTCSVCGYSGIIATQPTAGEGTSASPYEIGTTAELLWFAEHVNEGSTLSCGKLTADIDFSSSSVMIGSSSNYYTGTFDGDYHTVTVEYDTSEECTALFRWVNGATIQNLTVAGTITSNAKYASGIVARASDNGVTIENCISAVAITSTLSGDGTYAGIVANTDGTTTIANCAFVGSITGNSTTGCAGIISWPNKPGNTTLTNCYTTATYSSVSGSTFTRNDSSVTFTNCYYLNALDTAHGTAVTSDEVTSGALAYKLNGGVSGGSSWYQTIGTDSYPVPDSSHGTVYPTYNCGNAVVDYSNTEGMSVHGSLTATAAKAATCTESGNQAYWICDTCGKVFSDEDGTAETTVAEMMIVKLAHSFTAETATDTYLKSAATSTDKAVYYKSCSVCGTSSAGTDGEATFEYGETLTTETESPTVTTTGSLTTETESPTVTTTGSPTTETESPTVTTTGSPTTATESTTESPTTATESPTVTTTESTAMVTESTTESPTTAMESPTVTTTESTATTTVATEEKGITVKKDVINLKKKKSTTLKPVLTGGLTGEITYSSSNKKVATVNKNGKVTAKKKTGKAIITIKCGNYKKKVTVYVNEKLTLKKSSAKIKVKGKTTIKAKTNIKGKITYTSSNPKVATVSKKGVVKGIKKGKATITVKCNGKTKKFKVTVK